MDDLEFRLCLKIDVVQLDLWIEQGWLIPEMSDEGRQFHDADVARARLILDLMGDMGVNEAGVDVVMDLVNQLHGLRGTMDRLVTAISLPIVPRRPCNSSTSSMTISTPASLTPMFPMRSRISLARATSASRNCLRPSDVSGISQPCSIQRSSWMTSIFK